MILILSQAHQEASTDQIIDWISYYKGKFRRINGIDFYKNIRIEIGDQDHNVYFENITWDEVGVVWFRRWISEKDTDHITLNFDKNNIDGLKLQFHEFIRKELRTLLTFFFDCIPEGKFFEKRNVDEINKLMVLRKAAELDICIPNTYILTKRSSFEKLASSNKLITKAISNAPTIHFSNKLYCGYTASIDKLPEEIESFFSPSLFQESINKKYEIRAFLLSGKFYSMAIFSQNDAQTQLDFRRYNHDKPNRVVPYQLPNELENKLFKLADSFGLKSGSFDLIKTIDNQYVFLEVNPDGQFGMVSYPCNYHLERKFATELLNFEINGN